MVSTQLHTAGQGAVTLLDKIARYIEHQDLVRSIHYLAVFPTNPSPIIYDPNPSSESIEPCILAAGGMNKDPWLRLCVLLA